MHRFLQLTAAGAAAMCLVACGSASPDSPTPSSSATPTSPTATATPTPTPQPVAFEATLSANDYGATSVFEVDGGYVAASRHVVGYGPSGKRRWVHRLPTDADAEIFLAGGAIIATYRPVNDDVWPSPQSTVGLDPQTGAVLWRDQRSAFISAHGDTVFTTACVGVQNRTLGNCTLSSRNPQTGSTRWSIPTYHASEITQSDNGLLLMISRPQSGHAPVWTVLDAASGRRISADLDLDTPTIVGNTLVSAGGPDRRTEDGCRQVLSGHDFSGKTLWRKGVNVGQTDGDDPRCGSLYPDDVRDGFIGLSSGSGRPVVVEGATGRLAWRGKVGEEVPVVSRSLVVAVASEGGWTQGVRAIRPAGAKVLWSDPQSTSDTWILDAGGLVSSRTDCFDPCYTQIRNPRTGKVRKTYAGGLTQHGPGWVGTLVDEDSSGPVTVRVGKR